MNKNKGGLKSLKGSFFSTKDKPVCFSLVAKEDTKEGSTVIPILVNSTKFLKKLEYPVFMTAEGNKDYSPTLIKVIGFTPIALITEELPTDIHQGENICSYFSFPFIMGTSFERTKYGEGDVISNPSIIEIESLINSRFKTLNSYWKQILDDRRRICLRILYEDIEAGMIESEITASVIYSDQKEKMISDGPNQILYSMKFKNLNYKETEEAEKEKAEAEFSEEIMSEWLY